MMIPIIVLIGVALIAGSIIYTKKYHNPVEEIASEIIEKETGIDIDKMLPDDPKPKK